MKHIGQIGIITLLGLLVPTIVFGAAASPSATPASSDRKQIQDLQERLATKVAQMQQIQREAIFGKVKTVSIAAFSLSTATKDLKIDLTEDIKVYQYLRGKRTALTTDDLSNGDIVTVFGNYNSTLDLMKAKVIFIEGTIPVRIAGMVTDVDKSGYTISVKDATGQIYTVDFETSTKALEFAGGSIVKGGFSKIMSGNYITILGTTNPKNTLRISASRILNYNPNLTPPTVTPVASVSVTPTAKVTQTATPTVKSLKPSVTVTP
jgi:hypothetical protein